ncbi:MAG: trypsin-like peptidase domain-containing protein [Planctomycetaceae bacterium]|nr:trypsin-like peptidase domain-containing protein [Planctomycetaceae bacterium]
MSNLRPVVRPHRLRCLALLGCLLATVPLPAEEPVVRLAPIPAVAGRDDRVDPMRPARLSASERERLYEQAARDAEHLEQQGRQLRRLMQLIRPTVVHIDATKPLQRPRNGKATEDETGSGVIAKVAGRTVVLTNRHVVNRAELDAIAVRLDDGREVKPRRLWSDAGTDIAVLELAGDDLQTARLAEGDRLEIGDTVLAIGSPFGLAHSVTLGIVSAKGRRDLELGQGTVKFQDFIQTDAAINPGNSGGPLVNLRGEVVGINTCIASNSGGNEGIGFAIPMPMVLFVARQLVENGSVSRGYLGVTLDKEFSPRAAGQLGMVRPVGARVVAVTPGAPADTAGIRGDDVILEYDGTPVEDDDHLMSLVSMTPADRTVDVVLFRNRQRVPLRIPVASRSSFE